MVRTTEGKERKREDRPRGEPEQSRRAGDDHETTAFARGTRRVQLRSHLHGLRSSPAAADDTWLSWPERPPATPRWQCPQGGVRGPPPSSPRISTDFPDFHGFPPRRENSRWQLSGPERSNAVGKYAAHMGVLRGPHLAVVHSQQRCSRPSVCRATGGRHGESRGGPEPLSPAGAAVEETHTRET